MQKYFLFSIAFILSVSTVFAQSSTNWPKAINRNDTIIKIYQPLVESYSGNTVVARGAFSILPKGITDPVFGALWINATIQTNRQNRTAIIEKIKVNDVKFAGDSVESSVTRLTSILETEIPKWGMVISLDQLEASMEENGTNGTVSSDNLSTTPPKIIY